MSTVIKRANKIVAAIKPILAGEGPEVQGVVLAELLSLYLAGHAPQIRKEILVAHIECVLGLVPIADKALFGASGHPSVEGATKQ